MFGFFKSKEIEWPFDQPKNCAVFTIRQILEKETPIHVVYHDLDDNGWQFLSNIEYAEEDARIVSLEEITTLDPSIIKLAKMKPGYHAWRKSVGDKWIVV